MSLKALSLSSWNSSHFDLLCKWRPTGAVVEPGLRASESRWRISLLYSNSVGKIFYYFQATIKLFPAFFEVTSAILFVCFSNICHFCLLRFFYSIVWLKCAVNYCTLIKISIMKVGSFITFLKLAFLYSQRTLSTLPFSPSSGMP